MCSFFFFNDTATTEIYTLSLHDALPISGRDKIASTRPIRAPLILFFFFTIFMLVVLLGAYDSARAGFDASYITSDITFTNTGTMSEADIQAFLQSKGSYLAGYHETRDSNIGPNNDVSARGWSAAKIIWQVANWYGVNPEVILTTLQKEQSLVTNPSPPQWALDWAMGYGCRSEERRVGKECRSRWSPDH